MKIKICTEAGCKNSQTVKDYCRLHYLKNWKKLKEKEKKAAVDRLNRYVEGICKKHPDRYVDVIRREVHEEKGDFEPLGELSPDDFSDGFTFKDDEGLDNLLSRIKIDKDF